MQSRFGRCTSDLATKDWPAESTADWRIPNSHAGRGCRRCASKQDSQEWSRPSRKGGFEGLLVTSYNDQTCFPWRCWRGGKKRRRPREGDVKTPFFSHPGAPLEAWCLTCLRIKRGAMSVATLSTILHLSRGRQKENRRLPFRSWVRVFVS